MKWRSRSSHSVFAFGLVAAIFATQTAGADNGVAITPAISTPLTLESLRRADQATLESLYRAAAAGAWPLGRFAGVAIPSPGSRDTLRKSKLIGLLWKGKQFPGDGIMVNRLALGVQAVRADVYYGPSWLDGRESIVLDYANTSRLFHNARDEMREIAPGLYLGVTYVRESRGPKLATFYAVQAMPCGQK